MAGHEGGLFLVHVSLAGKDTFPHHILQIIRDPFFVLAERRCDLPHGDGIPVLHHLQNLAGTFHHAKLPEPLEQVPSTDRGHCRKEDGKEEHAAAFPDHCEGRYHRKREEHGAYAAQSRLDIGACRACDAIASRNDIPCFFQTIRMPGFFLRLLVTAAGFGTISLAALSLIERLVSKHGTCDAVVYGICRFVQRLCDLTVQRTVVPAADCLIDQVCYISDGPHRVEIILLAHISPIVHRTCLWCVLLTLMSP